MLHAVGKTHIPPETAFVFGTEREQKLDKQHEIDVLKANIMRKLSNVTIIIPPVRIGAHVGHIMGKVMQNSHVEVCIEL